jgi:hypothetical protein
MIDLAIVTGGVKHLESVSASAKQAATLAANADAIRTLHKRSVNDIIEIGCRLVESRDIIRQTPGRRWLHWLNTQFGWTDRTARNFIAVFELSKSENFSDLGRLPKSALYPLAAPSIPKPLRTEILDRAKTEDISLKDVEEALNDFKFAKALGRREHEKAIKKHLQEENCQVAQYTKTAIPYFRNEIKVAHACIERFSAPETKRFIKRRHKEIIAQLQAFEKALFDGDAE